MTDYSGNYNSSTIPTVTIDDSMFLMDYILMCGKDEYIQTYCIFILIFYKQMQESDQADQSKNKCTICSHTLIGLLHLVNNAYAKNMHIIFGMQLICQLLLGSVGPFLHSKGITIKLLLNLYLPWTEGGCCSKVYKSIHAPYLQ